MVTPSGDVQENENEIAKKEVKREKMQLWGQSMKKCDAILTITAKLSGSRVFPYDFACPLARAVHYKHSFEPIKSYL